MQSGPTLLLYYYNYYSVHQTNTPPPKKKEVSPVGQLYTTTIGVCTQSSAPGSVVTRIIYEIQT